MLWGELSGIEHVKLYGHVKGVYWREVEKQSEDLLDKVPVLAEDLRQGQCHNGYIEDV